MNERIINIYDRYAAKFEVPEIKKNSLYIVAVPIGNIEDISFRAISILKNADLIASEDTRNTNFLLQQYGIGNRTVSYYSYVETGKADYFINEIRNGRTVALVSDAGTPCISDPGNILVSNCIENGIDIISVPGCSSLIHSLVLSGFTTKKFYFQGFLPQKKGRQTLFKELVNIKMPVIIFESPFRIYKTMKDIMEYFGNTEISVSRELTKKFEQVLRGKVKSLLDQNIKTKGEFVIIINNI